VTVEQVAEKLEVSVRTIREWIASGELTAVNTSRNPRSQRPRLRVLDDEFYRFLERRSTKPTPKASSRRKLPPVGNWKL
jgi:excisionase family DNA binding protein